MTEVAVLLLTVIVVVVDSRVARIHRRHRLTVEEEEDISTRERGPEARLRTQERT
jgi:hypothetical protein